ncbi:MAG: T9SS type A sorting domain-containing protein [Adhaeribacter sp.]
MTITLFCLVIGSAKGNNSFAPTKKRGFLPGLAATVWQVGPTRTYTRPSQIATLVQDGDIIEIDAATYVGDVVRWTKHNLTFRGVGGVAHLDGNYKASGRKAIWVIGGNNNVVENIRFSNCKDLTDVDKNWAGIRMEGTNLEVRNCSFFNNSNGILCGVNLNSDILITRTVFDRNGHGDGQSHNLYIGQVRSLTFTYNYSTGAFDGGHELKSRAVHNYILYNRISDEAGTASRLIDLPNGGISVVMGNVLQKGPKALNRNLIGYGLESVNPGPEELYVVNNTLINDHANNAPFIAVGRNTELLKAYNNIFAGPHSPNPNQYFEFRAATTAKDISNNLLLQKVADAGLVDAGNFDYHLTQGSAAIGAGTNAGTTSHGFNLTPVEEYVHPTDQVKRQPACTVSLGAYEYGTPTTVQVATDKPLVYYGYAPEATATLSAAITADRTPYQVLWSTGETTETIQVSPATTTVYSITITDAFGCQAMKEVTVEVIDVRCGPANHQKVVLCHQTGQQICVDAHAVPAHLKNGAVLGTCHTAGKQTSGTESTGPGPEVSAYPNPFSDRMNIKITSEKEEYIVFEIYDLNGTLVKQAYAGNMTAGQVKHLEVDTSELNESIYIGKIITADGVKTIQLKKKQ